MSDLLQRLRKAALELAEAGYPRDAAREQEAVAEIERLEAERSCRWHPVTKIPPAGDVWVAWTSEDTGEQHASLGHYEPADGFCFTQPSFEYQLFDNYTYDYIGAVTHWMPVTTPPTPLECEAAEAAGGEE